MKDDKFDIIDNIDKQYKDLAALLQQVPNAYVPPIIKTVMGTYWPCFGQCTSFYNLLKREGKNIVLPEDKKSELDEILKRSVW